MPVVALDAMGGDYGLPVTIPAAIDAVKAFPDLSIVLVGDEEKIRENLKEFSSSQAVDRLSIRHTTQEVTMDEPPAQALRLKRDSSMRVCINLVKEGEAQACVSAGNTGALMATAKYVLKTLPGIDRPAICGKLPTMEGHTWMLDLGANLACSAEQLYQFAVMGAVLVSAAERKTRPRIGLLNIGQEDIKGNDQVRGAAKLLTDSDLNYIGFVEGNNILSGQVDVVVCDGFTGNIALKTMEGTAKTIAHFLKEEFMRNTVTKISGIFAKPVLSSLKQRIDPRKHNGATFLGLGGVVIKSHGSSDQLALAHALSVARMEALEQIPQKIDRLLENLLSATQPA